MKQVARTFKLKLPQDYEVPFQPSHSAVPTWFFANVLNHFSRANHLLVRAAPNVDLCRLADLAPREGYREGASALLSLSLRADGHGPAVARHPVSPPKQTNPLSDPNGHVFSHKDARACAVRQEGRDLHSDRLHRDRSGLVSMVQERCAHNDVRTILDDISVRTAVRGLRYDGLLFWWWGVARTAVSCSFCQILKAPELPAMPFLEWRYARVDDGVVPR